MNSTSELTSNAAGFATLIMHQHYPGKYRVVENYEPARGCFEFKLKFDDPREETLFLIKYS
jgi:hypothetical protein